MSDYTPVPEADLEAAIMETLTLLRQNSNAARAEFREFERLTKQINSAIQAMNSNNEIVSASLNENTTALKESKLVIENSRPIKKPLQEQITGFVVPAFWCFALIAIAALAILLTSNLLLRFHIIQ